MVDQPMVGEDPPPNFSASLYLGLASARAVGREIQAGVPSKESAVAELVGHRTVSEHGVNNFTEFLAEESKSRRLHIYNMIIVLRVSMP